MEAKVQGMITWLAQLFGREQVPTVTVKRLEGTNIEAFKYDGYDVEVSIYTDRVCAAVYHHGRQLIKIWHFATPDGEYIEHNHLNPLWPSYKIRHYVTRYVAKRLKEIVNSQEKL